MRTSFHYTFFLLLSSLLTDTLACPTVVNTKRTSKASEASEANNASSANIEKRRIQRATLSAASAAQKAAKKASSSYSYITMTVAFLTIYCMGYTAWTNNEQHNMMTKYYNHTLTQQAKHIQDNVDLLNRYLKIQQQANTAHSNELKQLNNNRQQQESRIQQQILAALHSSVLGAPPPPYSEHTQ